MGLSEEIRLALLSSLWHNPSEERKGIALHIALHTSGKRSCYNSKVDFESSGSERKTSVQLPLLLMLILVCNS